MYFYNKFTFIIAEAFSKLESPLKTQSNVPLSIIKSKQFYGILTRMHP